MPVADVPPYIHDRVVCSVSAAIQYRVPANILLAIAEIEAGKPGQWVQNSNGTQDVGPMQFNSAYLAELKKYGITQNDVAASGCYPYFLAAWRVYEHIKYDKGDLWTRVANYHSRTPDLNASYRANLRVKAEKWANWLETYYVTVDISKK
jgi:hypothetical protein